VTDEKTIARLVGELAGQGRPLEAGWLEYELRCLYPGVPADLRAELRKAYLAGASRALAATADGQAGQAVIELAQFEAALQPGLKRH
jgi:hypothetical protein